VAVRVAEGPTFAACSKRVALTNGHNHALHGMDRCPPTAKVSAWTSGSQEVCVKNDAPGSTDEEAQQIYDSYVMMLPDIEDCRTSYKGTAMRGLGEDAVFVY